MVMMMIAILALLIPSVAAAQSKFNLADAFEVLWRWLPFIVGSGFVMNLLISFFTMAIGTAAGVLLGLGQISLIAPLHCPSIASHINHHRAH